MSKKGFRVFLLIWSAMFATIIIFLNIPESKEYISYSYVRIDLLDSFMVQIENGKIPQFLSAIEHSWGFAFYLPYLGVMLGIEDAWKLVLLLHMSFMWILLAVFPAEIYTATKNRYLALISPVMLHIFCGNTLYGYKCDSMWAAGWAVVITAPLLYMFYFEKSRKKEMRYVLLIGFLCSVSNIMRNHCGFYVMVVFIFLLFVKFAAYIHRKAFVWVLLYYIALFVVFKIMYGLISDTVPLLAGIILNREVLVNSAFLWHAVLCSLGNYPNSFGLECKDEVVIALVMDTYPGVGRYTNEYLYACRDLFFKILKEEPLFVGKAWLAAFWKTLGQAFQYQMTSKKQADWYFYGIRYNVHNIFIPAVLSVVGYIIAVVKGKKGMIFEKETVIWFVCCILIILSGTVQAVFMVPALRYFLPSCVGIGWFFFTAAMRAQWLLLKGGIGSGEKSEQRNNRETMQRTCDTK